MENGSSASGPVPPEFEKLLREVAASRMPFGKYGPEHYPPGGVPIYDLPYDYLAWFARKGFPGGRFGELLRFVYLAKQDGADAMFDPLREQAGGRTSLRRPRRRRWEFTETEDDP